MLLCPNCQGDMEEYQPFHSLTLKGAHSFHLPTVGLTVSDTAVMEAYRSEPPGLKCKPSSDRTLAWSSDLPRWASMPPSESAEHHLTPLQVVR